MNRKMIGIVILASMVSGFLGGMIAESMERFVMFKTFGGLKAGAIEAQSILLTDPRGTGFISLDVINSSPVLEIHGSRGSGTIRLRIVNSSPVLEMYDANGRRRSMIGWASRKTGLTGESFITFFDKKGRLIWQAPQ